MNIPSHITERLLLLSPHAQPVDAARAIEALYETPAQRWTLLARFSIPHTFVNAWCDLAEGGADVCPAIDAYLNDIGVTTALLASRQ